MTREELYELVWSTPINTLCKEYGISNVGLAKVCKRHNVPTPPRGYWNKLAAGKPVRSTPLPKRSKTPGHVDLTPKGSEEPTPRDIAIAEARAQQKARAAQRTDPTARPEGDEIHRKIRMRRCLTTARNSWRHRRAPQLRTALTPIRA
jgi:hypothetical protein